MVKVDYRPGRPVLSVRVGDDRKLRIFVSVRVCRSIMLARTHGAPAVQGLETRALLRRHLEVGVSKAELSRRFCVSANARGPNATGASHDIW